MRNKKFSITLLLALSLAIVGMFGVITITSSSSNSVVLPGEFALMDLTHPDFALKEAEASQLVPMGSLPNSAPAVDGDVYVFEVSDDYMGEDYDEDFVIVAEGEHILILVTLDAYNFYLAEGFYNFSNPIGDNSEPWLRYGDIITTEMINYMVDEFDTNIYPSMADVYGIPASRPTDDTDPEYDRRDKIWTLVFNIKDEAYYDVDAGSYIAGYFSLSDSNSNQKNIMHIDTFEWDHRTGTYGDPWFIDDGRSRPHLYESTFAHEYEHMIHADIDPDEPSWVDEGLADLSGYICGYGHPDGHILYYLAFHAFTSLTFWGGGLEDYGASYLFQYYLFEKYGGAEFVTDLVQEQANGIEGIVKTLRKHHVWYPFDWIFDWWTIANYLDDTSICGGRYGYENLEMGSGDSRGWTMDFSLSGYWGEPIFEKEWELEGWWGVPQPYTAHYYRFTTTNKWYRMYIDGEDFAGTTAFSGTYEWYSDAEAWAWRSFYQTFDIPGGGATLNFMTYFEIEGDWDYGYVEVYDHDTDEWWTLDAAGTVDYVAHAQDNPNTPVEREPTTYETAGRWHAFTGDSGGDWLPVSMDLTPFAGDTIDLYFTTWQDGAFTLQMMYVDDIEIIGLQDPFFDDVEAGEDGWTSTGWYVTDGIQDNGFAVTIVTLGYPLKDPDVPIEFQWVNHIWVWSGTQSGQIYLRKTGKNQIYLAIVSNRANHILPSGYVLGVEKKRGSWWNWGHHWWC